MPRSTVRYRTLLALENILQLLIERHGPRMTLGELLAVISSMARLCKQDSVTTAEIAEATGIPKQSISRWANKRIGVNLIARTCDDDQRVTEFSLMNPDQADEHISELAKILRIR